MPLPTLRLATDDHRAAIHRMRHAVYAHELGQHPANDAGELRDELDAYNTYIVAESAGEVAGFVSVTPPGHRMSVDRYLERLPFARGAELFEVRLLTVAPGRRRGALATLLMHAALRWVEARGGRRVVALGRAGVLGLYEGVGLRRAGPVVRAGAVEYHLLHASTGEIRATLGPALEARLARAARWELPVPFAPEAACYHGGAFFEAVGPDFRTLERREQVVNADVLDAWFPPAPGVLDALCEHLPWLVRTSPPTQCEGLVRAVAGARGVDAGCILPGAGSSDLIFRALPRWLTRQSRVLILDPMYGEYAHVLEEVVRCRVDRFALDRAAGYALDAAAWAERVRAGRYDLAILVNPNSPTGRFAPRAALEAALASVPARTRVWVDETYVDFAGAGASLERWAAGRENVVVCKSMSKAYALSGMRVAYLCAAPRTLAGLRPLTPPWVVGLPAQLAAVRALEDPAYYAARWAETHALRDALAAALRALGVEVVPGAAGFLLCHLPPHAPTAARVVAGARRHGLFLRDVGSMGTVLGDRALRIAVKDGATNRWMARVLGEVLDGGPAEPPGETPPRTDHGETQ
jgi:histidinol-phosphate/aromatic aminotransferase/cobyric acid decarboxylase-like protein/GNAT superfamily N-acetyltransferase